MGLFDFLDDPEVRSGLLQAGLTGMYNANVPNSNPASPILGFFKGRAGYQQGQRDLEDRELERQKEQLGMQHTQAQIEKLKKETAGGNGLPDIFNDDGSINFQKATAVAGLSPQHAAQVNNIVSIYGAGQKARPASTILSEGRTPTTPTGATTPPATVASPPPTSSGQPPAGGGQPRSVRNNNPGNLKATSPDQPQDADGFRIFATPEEGAAAADNQLRRNYEGRNTNFPNQRFTTPGALVDSWLGNDPANSPESRQAYKEYVARGLNIGINDEIPPEKLPQVRQLMSEFESGIKPKAAPTQPSAPLATPGPDLSPVKIPSLEEFAAKKYPGVDLPTVQTLYDKDPEINALREEEKSRSALRQGKAAEDLKPPTLSDRVVDLGQDSYPIVTKNGVEYADKGNGELVRITPEVRSRIREAKSEKPTYDDKGQPLYPVGDTGYLAPPSVKPEDRGKAAEVLSSNNTFRNSLTGLEDHLNSHPVPGFFDRLRSNNLTYDENLVESQSKIAELQLLLKEQLKLGVLDKDALEYMNKLISSPAGLKGNTPQILKQIQVLRNMADKGERETAQRYGLKGGKKAEGPEAKSAPQVIDGKSDAEIDSIVTGAPKGTKFIINGKSFTKR